MPRRQRPAVFLDRDGVLNEGVRDPDSGLFESPLKLADVRLLAGAAGAVRRLARRGVCARVRLQSAGGGKGQDVGGRAARVHERVLELLEQQGAHLDASRLCPHHPDGVVDDLSGPCDCRKPAAGMLLDAAERAANWTWRVVDDRRHRHRCAGRTAAGCRTVLIEHPGSAHKRRGEASPDLLAADLAEAVAQLLAHDSPRGSTRSPPPRRRSRVGRLIEQKRLGLGERRRRADLVEALGRLEAAAARRARPAARTDRPGRVSGPARDRARAAVRPPSP